MWISVVLCAALLGAQPARAQVDSFSLNFTKITYEYRSARTGAVPFALDLVVGEQGSVGLHAVGGHNLSFKRGTFHPADPLPQSWLGFDLDSSRGARVGVLDLLIDQQGAAAGPHVKVIDGQSGAGNSVHSGGVQVLMGDGSVRFVRDNVDVRLWGVPAQYFNNPGPGEPLEARLPTPAPGQSIELQLKVMDDRGASMLLPVRISHPH